MTTSNPHDDNSSDEMETQADADQIETQYDSSSDMPMVSLPSAGPSGPGADVPEIEGYRITGKLGSGAMGTVWRAVQLGAQRDVALKLLGSNMVEKDRLRFEREVALCARLEHSGIARVYDSGLFHNAYYYAMELVDGQHMDRYATEVELDHPGVLRMIQATARAVQHAHQRGVIHRDLKPSNIIVSRDGQPHVVDFGLARTFLPDDQCIEVSVDGSIAGTPAFMAPEQAAGRTDELDTRTDTYALGVILFYLLSGEFPRDMSGAPYEVLARIADEEVIRPRSICGDIDSELEAILLKAMALKPDDRYASVGEFANDIENYLTGEPLTARSPTLGYFLKKRIVKHRRAVAAAGALVLAIVFGVAFYIYSIRTEQARTDHARKMAVQERDLALANQVEAVRGRNLAMVTFKSFVYEVQPVLASESAPLKLRAELVDLIASKLPGVFNSVGTLDTEADRLVAVTTLISGHVSKYAGDTSQAEKKYSKAIVVFEALAKLTPRAFGPLRELEIAHAAMGQLKLLGGFPDKAAEHLDRAMEIVDQLKDEHPGRSRILSGDRWVILIAKGQAELDSGDPGAAVELYAKAMQLAGSRRMQQAATLRSMGQAQLAMKNSSSARKYYTDALSIEEARVKAAPKTRGPRHAVSECRRQLAMIDLLLGDADSARQNCTLAIEAAQWLAEQDPDRISGWGELAQAMYAAGRVETAAKNHAPAAGFYGKCAGILKQLDDKGKLNGYREYRQLYDTAGQALKAAGASGTPSE
jgi:tetratricopeptide (TPR) repeat protein